jgi:hypothetical protein
VQEQEYGPKNVWKDDENRDEDVDDKNSPFDAEKLRAYELERLKYAWPN